MSPPSSQLEQWASRQVGDIEGWMPVGGATTAELWRVSTPRHELIVKAFTARSFVAEYPDCVDHAVVAMRHVAAHTDLVVPEVVAIDESGASAGAPTLVMTAIPGTLLEVPTRRTFDRIIDVAEQIHAIPTDGFPWSHHRYNEPGEVFVPSWFPDPGLFDELVAMSSAAVSDDVFIHRDFHPGNLLFDGDLVSGIVDWDYACSGPSGEDYGRTWLNLAIDYGERISTVFASRAARRLVPEWAAASWLDWLPFYESPASVEGWGTSTERAAVLSVGRFVTELA